MLGPSCLVKDTALFHDLKDLVSYIGYQEVADGRSASIQNVYNIIRQSGIEVDMQTVGHVYNEALPKTYSEFQSDHEVNTYVLKNYKDAIERAALLESPEEKEEGIGDDKPEIYVVNGLLNMFTNAYTPDNTIKSDMLQMQNALWKGIQRKLNIPEDQKPKTDNQWKAVLARALRYEDLGITDINGRLNGIADLYDSMREQLADARKRMEGQADEATMERWNEMVKQLEASTYSLLFSRGEAKKLLTDMMKEAGFAKELKNGTKILNWNKLADGIGSVQDLRSNVQRVLEDNGFDQRVVEGVKNSLENEFNDLHAQVMEKKAEIEEREEQKKETKLAAMENRLGKFPERRSDFRRLAELNNLGIFESTHDRVLYNLLNVPDLQQEDIEDLKILSKTASDLFREIDNDFGSDIFASRHIQTLQRHIDNIIARNINNKTGLLKIVSGVRGFFDIMLTGLLMRPFTILENLWSGVKEVLVPSIFGKNLTSEDMQIYRKMLSDVVIRGQAFGEEVGNFAPQELYTNMLKWKWTGDYTSAKGIKEKAESVLYALMMPARIGLLGFDSANKVVITNKVFNNAVYQALTQKGMNEDEAKNFMNEALYGESFEKAKERAAELIDKFNVSLPDKFKVPKNSRTITTFANDIVKHNLNADGALSNEVIEAAYKSAYHVAGYGLGHEANNWLSAGIKGYRNKRKAEGERLAKERKWDKLATHRLKDTLINSMVLRFTGGATNWMWLRIQSGLGVGLVTGLAGGDWKKDIDFKDKKAIRQSIKDIQNRRNMIRRALVGMSATALGYFAYYLATKGDDDPEKKRKLEELKARRKHIADKSAPSGKLNVKKDKLAAIDAEIKSTESDVSAMKRIKGSWMGSRLFKKMAPDLMLLHYYRDTDDNHAQAALDYVKSTTGIGSEFSLPGKVIAATALYKRGDIDAGNGMLSSVAGERFGVPTWQAYKDWFKLFEWIGGGTPTTDFKKPTQFTEGLWGGGAFEDLGFFKRDPKITILTGIGMKRYDEFKKHGIESIEDMKKNSNWSTLKDEKGDLILSKQEAKNIQKELEKYNDQK